MASFTLNEPGKFPSGTVVAAWPRRYRHAVTSGPTGGSPDDTATVSSTGTATFTGLTDQTLYAAYAFVDGEHRWTDFSTKDGRDIGVTPRFGNFTEGQIPVYDETTNTFNGRAEQTLNITDYGAAPTLADNTSIIQDLIDNAEGGTSILVPDGEFVTTGVRLSGTNDDKSDIHLVGTGPGSVLKMKTGVATPDPVVTIAAGTQFSIRNLKVEGNQSRGADQPPYLGIWVTKRIYAYNASDDVYVNVASDGTMSIPLDATDRVFRLLESHVADPENILNDVARGFWEEVTGTINNKYYWDSSFNGFSGIYVNGPGGALLSGCDADDTTLTLIDGAWIGAGPGAGTIEDEDITWTSFDGTSLLGVTRGVNSTTAASHAASAEVLGEPVTDVLIQHVHTADTTYSGIMAGSGPAKSGLVGSGVRGILIDGCNITSTKGSGIGGLRRGRCMVQGCQIAVSKSAINVDEEGYDNTIVNNILGGFSDAYGRYGVSSYRSDRVVTIGNVIRYVQVGVNYADTSRSTTEDGVVSGNIFRDISNTAITCNKAPYMSVVGNYIQGPANNGIKLTDAEFSTVQGNMIKDAGDYGIYTTDSYGIAIGGNTIRGSGIHGLFIEGGRKTTVTGNIIADSATLTAGGSAIRIRSLIISEAQSVSVAGTGGTLTLTFGANTTGSLAYNATAATVKTALEGLASIGAGNVSVSGGPLATKPIVVTFQGTFAGTDVAELTATSSVTGSGAGVSITTTRVASTTASSEVQVVANRAFDTRTPKLQAYGLAIDSGQTHVEWSTNNFTENLTGTILNSGTACGGIEKSTTSGTLEVSAGMRQASFVDIREITSPGSPSADQARLYVRDTGGKTELVVRFSDGTITQLAIQP